MCRLAAPGRIFQGEPVPPGYEPSARYPLRPPAGFWNTKCDLIEIQKNLGVVKPTLFIRDYKGHSPYPLIGWAGGYYSTMAPLFGRRDVAHIPANIAAEFLFRIECHFLLTFLKLFFGNFEVELILGDVDRYEVAFFDVGDVAAALRLRGRCGRWPRRASRRRTGRP